MPRPARRSTPALDAWHREIAAGDRTLATFDALWRAACREQLALDHAEFPGVAARYRREAADIVRQAAAAVKASA